MRAPGTASLLTSTSVLAGRASPKTSWRTRVHSGPVVDVGQEHRHLDDVREGRARGREDRADVREDLPRLGDDVARHEAPSPSTGTQPETNSRSPARTASV